MIDTWNNNYSSKHIEPTPYCRKASSQLKEVISRDASRGNEIHNAEAPARPHPIMNALKLITILTLGFLLLASPDTASGQSLKEIRHQARKAMKQERYADAIPLLKALVSKDSSDSETLFNLGLAMYSTGDSYGCIAYSTRGIAVDSANAAHHFRRGNCYSQIERYVDAIRDYTKAIELEPKSFTYYNRGVAKWKLDAPADALKDLNSALQLDPKEPDAYYVRALCHEDLRDTASAIADLNRSIALKPRDPNIYAERAFLRYARNDYAGAKADYEVCIRLDPAYIDAHLCLSELSLISGHWPEAHEHAVSAIKHSTNADEHALGLLFKCIAANLMNRPDRTEESILQTELDSLEEVSWEFDDLEEALRKQNISDEQRRQIGVLISAYYGN